MSRHRRPGDRCWPPSAHPPFTLRPLIILVEARIIDNEGSPGKSTQDGWRPAVTVSLGSSCIIAIAMTATMAIFIAIVGIFHVISDRPSRSRHPGPVRSKAAVSGRRQEGDPRSMSPPRDQVAGPAPEGGAAGPPVTPPGPPVTQCQDLAATYFACSGRYAGNSAQRSFAGVTNGQQLPWQAVPGRALPRARGHNPDRAAPDGHLSPGFPAFGAAASLLTALELNWIPPGQAGALMVLGLAFAAVLGMVAGVVAWPGHRRRGRPDWPLTLSSPAGGSLSPLERPAVRRVMACRPGGTARGRRPGYGRSPGSRSAGSAARLLSARAAGPGRPAVAAGRARRHSGGGTRRTSPDRARTRRAAR